MVNRESDRKNVTKDSKFGRRTYLKGVAASAALPIAAGMGGAADDGDYEEIVVGRNDRFTKTLSNGETWGNVVIDISAPGAKFRIRAIGDDWTVRNVGIRGVWDDPAKEEPFIASGNGRIENFYWADGTNWTAGGGAATGIFVPASHSGRIVMENLNLQDFGDNGVYASAPGNGSEHSAPGGGGEVIIRNSYAANCTPAGFRLGTDGSKLENCVMYRNLRNFWAFYEHTEVVDCDMSNADGTGDISQRGGIGDIVLGDSAWTKSNHAEVTAKNSYWKTEGAHGQADSATIRGSPENRSPRTDPDDVAGIPLSPEEAASESSVGTSSSDNSEDEMNTSQNTDDIFSNWKNIRVLLR